MRNANLAEIMAMVASGVDSIAQQGMALLPARQHRSGRTHFSYKVGKKNKSIAQVNRHTGQPHLHARECARHLRQLAR